MTTPEPVASSPYIGTVVMCCLVAGGVFLLVGLVVSLVVDVPASLEAKKAVTSTAGAAKDANAKDATGKVDAVAQGAVADLVDSVGKLAGSLKDLTPAVRLMMIGVFLAAIAAVGAGADAIGEAGGDSPAPSPSATST